MKKIVIGLLIATLTLGFVGCGDGKGNEVGGKPNTESSKPKDENKETVDDKVQEEENLDKDSDDKEESKEESKEEEKEFKLHLFNGEKLKEETIVEKIKIEDKAVVKGLTEALKKDRGEKYLKLPKEAEVTSAELKDDLLTINFSKNFIKDMTLGTATESGLITMIVNTYGNALNAKKVQIKLAGEIYTGLGDGSKDGIFTVDKK